MIKNYANKVMDYEYNAFMTLMNVSVSKHLFDEHFTVLWANDYFYDLIGYSKEEYESLFHNHVDAYYKDDPESVAYMSQIILDAYQKNESGYEFECPMHIKGGGTAWIRVTGRFTDEVFEGIPVIYTIYTDITKLKELQLEMEAQSKKLTAALAEAEQANRAKSDFLSRMSHDIRTPMNAIIGMTDIAHAYTNDPAKVHDCLKKISSSSQHLLGLINDVLDMSKIESGNMVLNMENTSLPYVLESVVSIMQPVFKTKNQEFSVRLHNVRHEDLLCDPLRLRQIFINVLSNASKFTPENGIITFDVEEIALSEDAQTVHFCFTITDSGTGIDPEFLPHIFDAFTRQQDSRVDKTEGSGLGMAITKKLTDLFGGSVRVESQVGKGSTFYVDLPMKVIEQNKQQMVYEGLKLLVVDDDQIACEYLVQTLKDLGITAEWADSGAAAVNQICQAHNESAGFDMVLLDWKMPGMDGVQTASAIREKAGDNLPILIASAYDWVDIQQEAMACGVDGFLQKPLFKSTLSWGIQNFVLRQGTLQNKPAIHSFDGKRLLLAEDNQLNIEIAEELLIGMGAIVETTHDGDETIAHFAQSPQGYYDLILMDIQMPKVNGYEAARQIRSMSRPDAQTIPILAMTADAFAEDVIAAKAAGMNSHIAKPLDALTMNREISKYL